jgi:hypothetical protein
MTRPMEFAVEDITPEQAQRFLDRNVKFNRPLANGKVEEYTRAMDEGRFKLTHEPMALARGTEEVLDGQHRLHAIVKHGKPVRMLVARNVDPGVFDVIGCGKTRNSTDIFCIAYKRKNGEAPAYTPYITSVASRMIQGLGDHCPDRNTTAEFSLKHYTLIHRIVQAFCKSHVKSIFSCPVMAAFANAALYFGYSRVETLIERCAAEAWTGPKDPAKLLYDRLLKDRLGGAYRGTGMRYSGAMRYNLGISAIRAFLTNRDIIRLEMVSTDIGQAEIDKRLLRPDANGVGTA